MARVRPLRNPTTPIDGESARGLFCRALGDHGIPLSFTVLRRLGMQYRNVVTIAEDPHLDIVEMARVIGVDIAEIEKRRYRSLGRKHLSFFGLAVPTAAVDKKVRRFSPSSLARSPHIRAIWELLDLPFCPESMEMLVDRCTCRVRQGWIRLNGVHRCDDCGRPLTRVPTRQVPEELHAGLALVAKLASPLPAEQAKAIARLPSKLRSTDRSRLYDCILRMRRTMTDGETEWREDLVALHDACIALLTWPAGIASLRSCASTPPSTWETVVSIYNNLPSADNRPSSPAPAPTIQAQAAGDAEARDRQVNVPSNLLGIRPAYELARLTPETLMAARSRGHLGAYERLRAGKLVPAFDPEEILSLSALLQLRIAAESVGYRLGIGQRAIQEFAACAHMTASDLSLNHEAWFTDDDISDFKNRLSAKKRCFLQHPIVLKTALIHLSGRSKPWGAVVGALLDGSLAFTIDEDRGKLFDAISIETASIRSIVKMRSIPSVGFDVTDRLTKGEALEIMNATISSSALRKLTSTGRGPITFLLDDVEELAKQGITVLEVATVTGETLSSVYHRINRLKINAVADGFWDRLGVQLHIPGV